MPCRTEHFYTNTNTRRSCQHSINWVTYRSALAANLHTTLVHTVWLCRGQHEFMDGQGWFWCSNKQIIDLTNINNNETTISSDSRTWDENSTFLKLNYFTVEHQKLAEAVRHILIRMNWSFPSSFHSAYRFSRNIRKEKKRRTLQSFPDSFWISHYLPCFAPILVIAQDTWTLKRTDDKNEQEYVWSKTEIISLQKNKKGH